MQQLPVNTVSEPYNDLYGGWNSAGQTAKRHSESVILITGAGGGLLFHHAV